MKSVRMRLPLDGTWEFIHVANDLSAKPVELRSIVVPGPWQAQFDDLRTRGGMGIYRRLTEIPSSWLHGDKTVFIRFGAVFHNTRVWINDLPAGASEGGFLPFSFDVTGLLKAGQNEVKLRVESPTDDVSEFPETPLTEIPFGKQSWYGPLSGVWQSVYFERCSAEHIVRLRLTPNLESGRVRARIHLAQALLEDAVMVSAIFAPSGKLAVQRKDKVSAGTDEIGTELVVPHVRAWSPDTPNLYRIKIALSRGGEPIDEYEDSFGFRTITVGNGRFFLNGEPLYLRGALDQDYYPDTICTLPSIEFLEDQAQKAKALGLNCLRCHIKAPDPRYYDVADRMGLLVWTELPNGGVSTERSRTRREATLKGIVDRDYNHPSIFCWTIINENWGMDLVHDSEHRAWLQQTYQWLKAYDPTRFVVDNSPLSPSFHVHTDIADYHFYAAFPDSRLDWDSFVDQLAARAPWLFSPEGDAITTGDEPLICSEFGNWGLPDPEAIKNLDGSEPWWFETGHDWGEGVMYPHGLEHRFLNWSLDRVFVDLSAFVTAAQWQQFYALKYEIETLRRNPSIAGYVITQMADVHWEANGLLDMRRNPRAFHNVFSSINADTVIVPRWERLSYWADETVKLDLHIAHGAGRSIDSASLQIRFGGEQNLSLPRINAGSVLNVGQIELSIPEDDVPALMRVEFDLRSSDGLPIAKNSLDVAVHHRRSMKMSGRIWAPSVAIRDHLSDLGFPIAMEMHEATMVISTDSDDRISSFVRAGGSLVLLPETEMSLNPFFPHWQNVKVVQRVGTPWRGDWASTFAWLRRGKAFGHLPGAPMLDATFDRVMPSHVINGCNSLDFQGRVYAGMVAGWIHKAAALVVERPYGKGRFVCSTFRILHGEARLDPTATMLLHGLINIANAPLRYTQGLGANATVDG